MATEIKALTTPGSEEVEGYCFRCTTTGLVFGPTLSAEEGPERAEEFLQWVRREHGDPRNLSAVDIEDRYGEWLKGPEKPEAPKPSCATPVEDHIIDQMGQRDESSAWRARYPKL